MTRSVALLLVAQGASCVATGASVVLALADYAVWRIGQAADRACTEVPRERPRCIECGDPTRDDVLLCGECSGFAEGA